MLLAYYLFYGRLLIAPTVLWQFLRKIIIYFSYIKRRRNSEISKFSPSVCAWIQLLSYIRYFYIFYLILIIIYAIFLSSFACSMATFEQSPLAILAISLIVSSSSNFLILVIVLPSSTFLLI